MDIATRIKNSIGGEGALSGTEHVGEGVAALVAVPRAHRRTGERALPRTRGEPEDEDRVGQADEGSDPLDGFLFARGRVREPEQLLEFTEADLDGPSSRVPFEDLHHRERGVGAEEDAVGDRTVGGLGDHDAEPA